MMTKVLFVCMGNICRSPSAEGVFRHLVNDAGLGDVVRIDSAGTHAFHIGEAPDARAQAAARKRGYEITHCEARQVTAEDFRDFDLILAMDWDNLSAMQQQCPKAYQHKLMLLMRFANEFEEATVPDPYYGGADGSARCWTTSKTPVRACSNWSASALPNTRRPEVSCAPGRPVGLPVNWQ